MKGIKLFLTFALIATCSIFTNAQESLSSAALETLRGEKVDILDYAKKGEITVISFWATWCSPCKKELDAISDLYDDWKADYGVNVIAVTVDNARSVAKVGPMVEQKGWEFTILSDKSSQFVQKESGSTSVPYTMLIDQEGNVVYRHATYVPGDEYELEDKIKALAKK